MKRSLLLLCLLTLLLVGCTRETVLTQQVNGVTYTLDTQAGTITGGGYTCRYTLSGDETAVSIQFPDGAYWTESKGGNSPGIQGSGTVGADRMGVAGNMAKAVWGLETKSPNYTGMLISAVIFMVGLFAITNPRRLWDLTRGWQLRYGEPSDAVLRLEQIAGAVMAVFSAFGFIFSLIPR